MTVELHEDTYLGDGLYCHYDGFQIWLRAPRSDGDHKVALEPRVLKEFLIYINRLGLLKALVPKECLIAPDTP